MSTRSSILTLLAVASIGVTALASTGALAKPVTGVMLKPTGVQGLIINKPPVQGIVINKPPVLGVVIHPKPINGIVLNPPHPIMGVIIHPPDHDHDHDHDHDWDHDHDHDWDHHAIWWHHRYPVDDGQALHVTTPVTTVPAAPCNCLTKQYLQDGSVLFKDVCTKEAAVATPDELRAQAQGPQAQ